MHRTQTLHKLVSTMGGMRRILKKHPPVNKYMRLAIDSGIYRDRDRNGKPEYLEQRNSPDGRSVEDYPIEYQILTLHPPYPPPPILPEFMRRRMAHAQKPHETQRLMKQRLKTTTVTTKKTTLTEAEYYERLLGVPPPAASSALGNKTAHVQQAYAFALKQWQIMREDGVSETESLERVNALLEREATEEKTRARDMRKDLQAWRETRKAQETKYEALPEGSMEKNDAQHVLQKSTVPSVFSNKERTIAAMTMWSQRLRAVPYVEWTIGASVALDHWVARSILNISEETWQTLLEGTDPSLASRGLDIVHARQAMFPETILRHDDDEEQDIETIDGKAYSEHSIESLLAKLGMDDDDEVSDDVKAWQNHADIDEKMARLVEKLQDWREKNAKAPYEVWNEKDKGDFDKWMHDYVDTLKGTDDKVDYDETRKALLSQPPVRREESDGFWTAIQDETDAEIFLQQLHKDGMPRVSLLSELFYTLPYHEQLQKLIALGTLRPLLDEYSTELKRKQFMAQHGHKLMEGVMTEHLVADTDGPIYGRELGRWGEKAGIKAQDRFRMEKIPYGSENSSDESIERARMLLAAWNELKVGRARFEEYLFGKGKLGLKYNEDKAAENHKDE